MQSIGRQVISGSITLSRLFSDFSVLICTNRFRRLRSCEAAYAQLEKFANSYQAEARIMEEHYQQLNSQTPPVRSQVIESNEPTKVLFTLLFKLVIFRYRIQAFVSFVISNKMPPAMYSFNSPAVGPDSHYSILCLT